jgi:hypothetical protein
MAHALRVVPARLLALVLLTAILAPVPAGAETWPDLTGIPEAVTVTPDGSFGCLVIIRTSQGPITGSYVEVEFSPEATALVAWTEPLPPGADVPTIGPGGGYLFSGSSDANGEVVFHIAGAGCVAEKSGDIDPYIVQIRADNFVMGEPPVNSPDAVDGDGMLPEDLGFSICDPVTSTTTVGLSDALFHTPAIKQGGEEICTDFTNDRNHNIGLADAGLLTPYVRAGTGGSCVYSGP